MDNNIDTATLTVEPVLGELKTFEPNPRIEALSFAIDSVRTFDNPPTPEHIVDRAETFLAFLSPESVQPAQPSAAHTV